MEGMEYYLDAYRNYFNFDGRARRSEYWYFILFNFLVSLLLLSLIFLIKGAAIVLYVLYVLATIIPNVALTIRRIHDTNRDGVNILFGLIPLVGGIILLVFMIEEGTHGPNKFGEDPRMINDDKSYI